MEGNTCTAIFRGNAAQMLPADKYKLFSFYRHVLLACLRFSTRGRASAQDVARAEWGSREASEEEEGSELCRSPCCPPAPARGDGGSPSMSLSPVVPRLGTH